MFNKKLIKKSITVIFVRIIGAVMTFLMTIAFARLLGSEEFGIFSLGLTIFMTLGILIRFGLENVVLKRVSEYLESDPSSAIGYLKSSLYFVMLTGLIVSGLLFIFSDTIANSFFHTPLLSDVLIIFSIGLIPTATILIITAAMKSLNIPIYATFLQSLLIPSLVIIFTFIFWIIGFITLNTLVYIYIISTILAAIFGYYIFEKKAPKVNFHILNWKYLVKQGWPMLMISSGAFILASSDILILGFYADPQDIGVYATASKTALVTTLILVGVNTVIAPKYAKLYADKRLNDISLLAQKSSLILFILVLFPSTVLLFFSDTIMSLFGKEFIVGSSILMILTLSQVINVSIGSVGYLLSMTGQEKTLMRIMFTTAFLNILFSVVLVQIYGVIGVASVTALSIVFWNIWAMIEVKKHLGFWMISMSSIKTMIFKDANS